MSEGLSRRQIIRSIALSLASTGVLDLRAAQHVHAAAQEEKAATGAYQPKFFQSHEYRTLTRLAELIVPADDRSGSAVEAGAPEFIDLLCSQSDKLGTIYTGGLGWLDAEMRRRYHSTFADAPAASQTAMLDLLVQAEHADSPEPTLGPGVLFFDWVRKMTLDGFYTSPIGIKDLDYRGNAAHSKYEVPLEAIQYAVK